MLLKYNFLNKETGSFYTGLAVPALILQCHGRSSGLHWMTAPPLYSHCNHCIPRFVCYDSIKIDYLLQVDMKNCHSRKIKMQIYLKVKLKSKYYFYNFQFYSFIVFYNPSINFNHQPFDQKYVWSLCGWKLIALKTSKGSRSEENIFSNKCVVDSTKVDIICIVC